MQANKKKSPDEWNDDSAILLQNWFGKPEKKDSEEKSSRSFPLCKEKQADGKKRA